MIKVKIFMSAASIVADYPDFIFTVEDAQKDGDYLALAFEGEKKTVCYSLKTIFAFSLEEI